MKRRTPPPKPYLPLKTRTRTQTITHTPSDVQSRRAPALIDTCHDARFAPHDILFAYLPQILGTVRLRQQGEKHRALGHSRERFERAVKGHKDDDPQRHGRQAPYLTIYIHTYTLVTKSSAKNHGRIFKSEGFDTIGFEQSFGYDLQAANTRRTSTCQVTLMTCCTKKMPFHFNITGWGFTSAPLES
jgi:hypothetical protein